ncbi:hypothetical protein F4777DRAFT_543722 [Nemania sp. FL0916]|nr:hypothetical protein F4777DRAFT_543722 [Nemania sp. FL0916]
MMMIPKSLLVPVVAGFGAYASAIPQATNNLEARQKIVLGSGVQGDFASYSKGWSTCAVGTIARLTSGIHLDFQADGNLVLYQDSPREVAWYSGYSDLSLPCANPCNCVLAFQQDGNLVTYINYGTANQLATWSSKTAGVYLETGTTAAYFEIYGLTVTTTNPFIAIVDLADQVLFSTQIHIPGEPPQCLPGQSIATCYPGIGS